MVASIALMLVAGPAFSADIYILEWNADSSGSIEVRLPSGERERIQAPAIPAQGLFAHLNPSGFWELSVDGKSIVVRQQAIKTMKATTSICVTNSQAVNGQKYAPGVNGCN